MMEIRLDRDVRTPSSGFASHPDKMEEIDHKVRAHYQVSEDADATEETADSDKSVERCGIKDADYRYQVGK